MLLRGMIDCGWKETAAAALAVLAALSSTPDSVYCHDRLAGGSQPYGFIFPWASN